MRAVVLLYEHVPLLKQIALVCRLVTDRGYVLDSVATDTASAVAAVESGYADLVIAAFPTAEMGVPAEYARPGRRDVVADALARGVDPALIALVLGVEPAEVSRHPWRGRWDGPASYQPHPPRPLTA